MGVDMETALRERIEVYVERLPDAPGCWIWTGHLNASGYANTRVNRHMTLIHRAAYELWRGPIPAGKEIDHLCRVRCCINPDHLEPVTDRENCLRGYGPAGKNARKQHCPLGHALDRVVVNKRNGQPRRSCRACMNASVARYQRRKAGKARPEDALRTAHG